MLSPRIILVSFQLESTRISSSFSSCNRLAINNIPDSWQIILVKARKGSSYSLEHTTFYLCWLFSSWVCLKVYWGAHILAFAVCLHQKEIVQYLLHKGANVEVQDTRVWLDLSDKLLVFLCVLVGLIVCGKLK